MARASFASMHLARFEALRASAASREAFVFVVLELHGDVASAERLVDDRQSAAPWLDETAGV